VGIRGDEDGGRILPEAGNGGARGGKVSPVNSRPIDIPKQNQYFCISFIKKTASSTSRRVRLTQLKTHEPTTGKRDFVSF
jgi:hypothetical protein